MSKDGKDTGDNLQRLSRKIFELTDSRDYDNPFLQEIFSSDFKAVYHWSPIPIDKTMHLQILRKAGELHPDYVNEIVDTCAEVDEHNGRGMVWMTLKVAGGSVEYKFRVTREMVLRLLWRRNRKKGMWQVVEQTGLSGGGASLLDF